MVYFDIYFIEQFYAILKLGFNVFIFYSCRFVFGGDHGKFKFELPDGHSPAIEALLPKEKLKLDQCFWFGDIHRNVIHGPMEIEYTPYVPKPVDTANVSFK